MLTLIKIPSSHTSDARIELPPETTQWNRERFERIAVVFYGHRSPDGSWIFTEMRGRKCLALWEAGFDANESYAKQDRRCIVHPNHSGKNGRQKLFSVSQAVDMAKVINKPAVEVLD